MRRERLLRGFNADSLNALVMSSVEKESLRGNWVCWAGIGMVDVMIIDGIGEVDETPGCLLLCLSVFGTGIQWCEGLRNIGSLLCQRRVYQSTLDEFTERMSFGTFERRFAGRDRRNAKQAKDGRA